MEEFTSALEAVVTKDTKIHIGRMCRSRQIGFSSDANDWGSVVAVYEISCNKGFADSIDEFIQSANACVALCELKEFERAIALKDVLRDRFAELWSDATAARFKVEKLLSSRGPENDVESN